ncbi:MAG: hypothetical protein ACYT04_69210 [Nostoc sp.]
MLVYAHQKHSAFKRCLRRAAPTPTKFLEEKRAIAYDERVHYRTLDLLQKS